MDAAVPEKITKVIHEVAFIWNSMRWHKANEITT